MPNHDQDDKGGERKLAPHVQAALAGGAQPKMPDSPPGKRPMAPHVAAATGAAQPKTPSPTPGAKPMAPHVQAALGAGAQPKMPPPKPGAHTPAAHVQAATAQPKTAFSQLRGGQGRGVVQRMEETTTTVNLSRITLSGDFQKILKCLALYSSSYVGSTPNIERNLKIGQYLGLNPPRVNFHCSGSPGTGKDEERAKQSQQAYTNWLSQNADSLSAVTVIEGGSSSNNNNNRGLYDESLHEKKLKEKTTKKQNKLKKNKQSHMDEHEDDELVGWPAPGAWKCKECNQWFQ